MLKKKDVKKRFGTKVRQIREEKGLTQEQLADKAGMHFTYIGQVERGVRNISLINIEKLAKALKVSGGDILPF